MGDRALKYFLIISVAVNILLGYLLPESGVTLDSSRTQYKHLESQSKVAVLLLNDVWSGKTRAELQGALESIKQKNMIVDEKEGNLVVGGVEFHISNNQINKVDFY